MRLYIFVVFAAIAMAALGFRSSTPLINALNTQRQQDSSIFAAAVATLDTNGAKNSGTAAVGLTAPIGSNQRPVMVDSSVRADQFGEVLIGIVFADLIDRELLTPDSSIDSKYLPQAKTFNHPQFPGETVTIRRLLEHKSSLIDTSAFAVQTSGGGTTVPTLVSFVETYFLRDKGSSLPATERYDFNNVWDTQNAPGTTYNYAKANIALLSFIADAVLKLNPNLIASTEKSLKAFINERIFATAGLTGTYILNRDGSFPKVGTSTAGLVYDLLSGRKIRETTQAGAETDAVTLSGAYLAEAMVVTCASDMAKLLRALFIDSTSALYKLGQNMRAQAVAVTDSSRPGVSKQGWGIVEFDAAYLCAAVNGVQPNPGGCGVSSNRAVYGWVSVGDQNAVGGICTDTPTVSGVAAVTITCTASMHSYNPTTTPAKTTSIPYAAMVAALNNIFIDPSVYEGTTVTESDLDRTSFFSFTVFLGLMGSIFAVLIFAYFAEYFLHPAPIAGNVASSAYPTLDEAVARASPSNRM